MRFVSFRYDGQHGLAVDGPGGLRGYFATHDRYPGHLGDVLARGAELEAVGATLRQGEALDAAALEILPPLAAPGKILCVGLNYASHAAETGAQMPDYPTIFARFASSLVGHGAPLVRPAQSTQLDYEGELVAVIGRRGRAIAPAAALAHVAGYAVFHDGSVRDFQRRTSQWTMGKNFDGTGGFGPALVTPDELPAGARGLRLRTRLNGEIMQDASTDEMLFDVARLVSLLSETMTLEPGDLIVTGTPPGVGVARHPPRFLLPGDLCEVEIEGIGVLRHPVVQG
jgi:2-keto-4-pentenoate hydratase/2-oxohepta-3-ene-1,7-dioic acid hydratase in catechol pathway